MPTDRALFLHHFLHTFPSLAVGDVDKIDARGQVTDVQCELFAFTLDRGHALAEGVDDLGLLEVSAQNGDLTVGWVGMKGGEGSGFVFADVISEAGLSPTEGIFGDGAEGDSVDRHPF